MAQLLLVGEDRERAADLRALLRKDGHEVQCVRDSATWPLAEREVRPDLIVAAVEAQEEVLEARGALTRGFPAPLLFIEHDGEHDGEHEGGMAGEGYLEDRLVDRLQSPFMAEELLARVDALVTVRQVVRNGRSRSEREDRESRPRGLGQRLGALLARRAPAYPLPCAPYMEVAARVAEFADRRDNFEPGHAGRVASFCAMMADGLDLPDHEVEVLLRAAMLHDIGKVTLPVEVLLQRGPLDEDRMRLVRTHAERGATLLRALERNDEVASVVLYHHERPDGFGYHGKRGHDIPRAARVLAVAEAFDAMTSARWGARLATPAALGTLREKRAAQFDADSVDALVDALGPRRGGIPLARQREAIALSPLGPPSGETRPTPAPRSRGSRTPRPE